MSQPCSIFSVQQPLWMRKPLKDRYVWIDVSGNELFGDPWDEWNQRATR